MEICGSHILANGDDAVVKVIFGVIAVIIWGIGSLVSALKKKASLTPQRAISEEAPLDLTPRMEVPPVRMSASLPPPPPPPIGLRPVAQRMKAPPAPRKAKAAVRPAPPRKGPPPLSLQPQQRKLAPASPPVAANPSATKVAGSRAADLASTLRPQLLRQQWLLTEILAKPLALREIDR